MKASWMSLTLALVCGGPVLAKTELELLRERRAELDRKIQQLEQQEKPAPETAPAKSEPQPGLSTPARAEERVYVVRKGDTLERISRKTRVSVATLEQLNRLQASTVIHIGQKLKLPPAVANPTKPKETAAPAATTSMAVKTISNPSTSSAPANSPRSKATSKSEPKSETKTTAPKLEAGNEKLVIHSIILQNRIVYSDVAAKYGTTTDRLNDLNGLSLSPKQLLQEGTELYVPVPAQP